MKHVAWISDKVYTLNGSWLGAAVSNWDCWLRLNEWRF